MGNSISIICNDPVDKYFLAVVVEAYNSGRIRQLKENEVSLILKERHIHLEGSAPNVFIRRSSQVGFKKKWRVGESNDCRIPTQTK